MFLFGGFFEERAQDSKMAKIAPSSKALDPVFFGDFGAQVGTAEFPPWGEFT